MCPCPVSTTARASEAHSWSKQSARASHKVMSSALALPCRMVTVAIASSIFTSIMGAVLREGRQGISLNPYGANPCRRYKTDTAKLSWLRKLRKHELAGRIELHRAVVVFTVEPDDPRTRNDPKSNTLLQHSRSSISQRHLAHVLVHRLHRRDVGFFGRPRIALAMATCMRRWPAGACGLQRRVARRSPNRHCCPRADRS